MLITETLHKDIVYKSHESIAYDLKHMLERLEETAKYISSQQMSEPVCLHERLTFPSIFCGSTGVYFITYAPNASYNFTTNKYELGSDAKIMYIGQGNISQRKTVHRLIFKNNGNPKTYHTDTGKISSQVDSVAARKMYKHDSNFRHWRFSYILAEKDWAPILERYYIQHLNPEFNDEKMSGVN